MRVFGWQTPGRNESEGKLACCGKNLRGDTGAHYRPIVTCERFEWEHICWDPKKLRTMPEQGEARGNSGGCS